MSRPVGEKSSAAFELLPWVLLLGVFLAAHLQANGWFYAASDDPYIYLGYVKMLIQPPHELFAYNNGEHSAGTTGILYYYGLIAAGLLARGLTFFLPIAESLTLGLYLFNSALFLGMAALLYAAWKRLVAAPGEGGLWRKLLLFALVCSHPKFLWGVFAGLENPLGAFLVVLLFALLVRRDSCWKVSLAAAALCATRPELTVMMSLVPAVAVLLRHLRPDGLLRREAARDLLRSYLLWGGVLALLVLPCYLSTGQLFPSALGPRIKVEALSDPALLWTQLRDSFSSKVIWQSSWVLLGFLLLALSLCLSPFVRTAEAAIAAGFILLSFTVRAAFGLLDFNAEDRYVSYLWPLYALGFSQCLDRPWTKVMSLLPGRVALRTSVAAVAVAAVMFFPLRSFWSTFQLDVQEMNDVVVNPSRWMAKHLPPGSRVCMEPAGAIRLFTEFYLIDRVGLTTKHSHSFRGRNYLDFLKENRVQYVFDYPGAIPLLANPLYFQRVRIWEPRERRRSGGPIGLFRVRPIP